jgi:RIO-like serine/threonine protein kinase
MQLKADLFGTVTRIERPGGWAVERDTRAARWWLRPLARHLAAREARALRMLAGVPGVPTLEAHAQGVLVRSWTAGEPMQRAQPRDPRYFRDALKLLRRLHRRGVAHNDLAKEPNWLVTPQGEPALVDFQLALTSPRRGRLFRTLARDDLRHLLKHKRTYCPARLTRREQQILANPSLPARLWMSTGKKLYLGVTRGLLGWADREGAGDRKFKS